jgi:hypothetical protein
MVPSSAAPLRRTFACDRKRIVSSPVSPSVRLDEGRIGGNGGGGSPGLYVSYRPRVAKAFERRTEWKHH